MGLDSIWHWAILMVVAVVIFGTGKLAKIGPDLGHAIRGFKSALHGHDAPPVDIDTFASDRVVSHDGNQSDGPGSSGKA